jgi:hypothetical protein
LAYLISSLAQVIYIAFSQSRLFTFIPSVVKGPKFRPQSSKRVEKNLVRLGKSLAELFPNLSKKGRKGAKLFLGVVFHKIIYIYCQKLGL